MKPDFYAVLGVERAASQAEIKTAFRDLARKFHPDRNPGDAEAEATFKSIAEAYRVLGDSDLRAKYDAHGATKSRAGSTRGQNAKEVLDEIFGTRRPPPRGKSRSKEKKGSPPELGVDLKYTLELELEEAALGCEKQILVPRHQTCGTCTGSGLKPNAPPSLCTHCHGTGVVEQQQGFFEVSNSCPRCNGSGRAPPPPCKVCSGAGAVTVEHPVIVTVPAGVDSGTRLKLAGEGDAKSQRGKRGDLYVVIEVRPHALFKRENDDIVTEVPVSLVLAALGGHIEVATLEGPVRMRVPAGSQNGRTFRLKGKGIASLDDGHRGDQRVRIQVVTPDQLTAEQAQLLERFDAIERAKDDTGSPLAEYEAMLRKLYR